MIKQSICIGLISLMSLSLLGETFISAGKRWNVRLSAFGYNTEVFKIEGDSMVGETTYQKIWASFDSLVSWSFQGLVREADNVVYYIPPNMSEGILYDFNLGIGETAYVKNIFCDDEEVPVTVSHIDTVEYFGQQRKRWHLNGDGFSDEYWIEGIGSSNGLLYTKYWYCIVCPIWELLCFHQNDTLAYIMEGETICFQTTVGIGEHFVEAEHAVMVKPNPVKRGNILAVETTTQAVSLQLYNPAGLLLKTIDPAPGNTSRIETTGLEAGLYLLRVITQENKMITKKILVE